MQVSHYFYSRTLKKSLTAFFTSRPSPFVLPHSIQITTRTSRSWVLPPLGSSLISPLYLECPYPTFALPCSFRTCLKHSVLHEIGLEHPTPHNQSSLYALLHPWLCLLSVAVVGPGMFHGMAVWKVLCRRGVLEKAAYLMPIHTIPIHSSNFKGSEKSCNTETC